MSLIIACYIPQSSIICYAVFWQNQKLFSVFYLKTNDWSKRQKNKIKAYFWAFINFNQNNKAQLLLTAEFAYNNAKNTNISHTFFEFNCKYYLYIFYKIDIDLCSKSKTTKEFFFKLQKLKTIYQYNLEHV